VRWWWVWNGLDGGEEGGKILMFTLVGGVGWRRGERAGDRCTAIVSNGGCKGGYQDICSVRTLHR